MGNSFSISSAIRFSCTDFLISERRHANNGSSSRREGRQRRDRIEDLSTGLRPDFLVFHRVSRICDRVSSDADDGSLCS